MSSFFTDETFQSHEKEEACASFHIRFCLEEWARGTVYIWLLRLHNDYWIRADSGFYLVCPVSV